MAHYYHFRPGIRVDPPPQDPGTRISYGFSYQFLLNAGFNIPVEVMTATVYRQPPNSEELRTMTIIAHFDTGASRTSIDQRIAQHLGLIPTGMGEQCTANGVSRTPTYAIDLHFPSTQLTPFTNLATASCDLPFDFDLYNAEPNNYRNIGLLLGRDVMSRWNVVWNGPTSTVFISD